MYYLKHPIHRHSNEIGYKMGTEYKGYQSLHDDFKRYQQQTPKGISLQNKRNSTIVLKFKINGKPKSRGCNCSFTLDGMALALIKAKKLADALKTFTNESEFWEWYDKIILDKNTIEDDRITFTEAIAKVENDFWSRPSRTGRKRDKKHPSDDSSWKRTYADFYKHLPDNIVVNLKDIQSVIDRWEKGTKNYGMAISAMKKLVRLARKKDILDELNELDTTQTKKGKRQSINLDEFLEWRDKTLGIIEELHPNVHLDTRKRWLWVFSMQIVYGLRIHEVFAIKNLDKPFNAEDNVIIPALSDENNVGNIIVIGNETNLGTSTKTGFRLARPLIPPSYPNLMEKLDIKKPMLPTNKPRKDSSATRLQTFYCTTAATQLKRWNAPFTQTHADRHLANLHGMQAGIPIEVRSQSLGHTPEMNERTYKKRQRTKETLNVLLQSNQDAIDFVAALNIAKKLVKTYPSSYQPIAELLAQIYGKNEDDVMNLL